MSILFKSNHQIGKAKKFNLKDKELQHLHERDEDGP